MSLSGNRRLLSADNFLDLKVLSAHSNRHIIPRRKEWSYYNSLWQIQPGLFVSNLASATNVQLLQTKAITHILTVDSVPLPRSIRLALAPQTVHRSHSTASHSSLSVGNVRDEVSSQTANELSNAAGEASSLVADQHKVKANSNTRPSTSDYNTSSRVKHVYMADVDETDILAKDCLPEALHFMDKVLNNEPLLLRTSLSSLEHGMTTNADHSMTPVCANKSGRNSRRHKRATFAPQMLVNCRDGLSRSPCILIAYLMKFNGWEFEYAASFITKAYPIFNYKIHLRPILLKQLMLFKKINFNVNNGLLDRNRNVMDPRSYGPQSVDDDHTFQLDIYKLWSMSLRMRHAKLIPFDELESLLVKNVHLQSCNGSSNVKKSSDRPDVLFKCKNCLNVLATSHHTAGHRKGVSNIDWSSPPPSDLCPQSSAFTCPFEWMRSSDAILHRQSGDIHCPQCRAEVGKFDWIDGLECWLCHVKISPAFWLDETCIRFETDQSSLKSVTFDDKMLDLKSKKGAGVRNADGKDKNHASLMKKLSSRYENDPRKPIFV